MDDEALFSSSSPILSFCDLFAAEDKQSTWLYVQLIEGIIFICSD
jgi:hypothetical protein